MSRYTSTETERLITHTGSHKKVLINLEIAERVLDKKLLDQLNQVLIEVNHIQETEGAK
jgi:hypothetical protein